jgi:hypothetical protein
MITRRARSWLPILFSFVLACSSQRNEGANPSPAAVVREPAPVASAVEAPAPPPTVASATPPSPEAEAAPSGADYADDARAIYRVAACGTSGDLPPKVDAGVVARHCGTLRFIYEQYKKRWLSRAIPFMATLRPPTLPKQVVYPFGGGDLFAALAVFPEAEQITTISLEPAGDVRGMSKVPTARLRDALAMNRRHLKKLLGLTYSKTTNLDLEGRSALPGEVVFLMAALAVHGLEPIALRYFSIREDGTLHYFTNEELAAPDKRAPGRAPAPEFSNVEIEYANAGATERLGVIRHLSQDLSDKALQSNTGLLLHLSKKGAVAAMTKAASHLLWADEFSMVRNYLLKNAVWMISDSTGIPPRFATAAGFVQDTFGKFDGPARYGPIEPWDSRDFRKLFAENPKKDLGFQFGYADIHRQIHLVVTRKTDSS